MTGSADDLDGDCRGWSGEVCRQEERTANIVYATYIVAHAALVNVHYRKDSCYRLSTEFDWKSDIIRHTYARC